jgi:hypothetical protein
VETKRKISKGLNSYHEDLGTSRKSDNPEHHKNCSNGFVRSNGNRTKEIRQHSCVFCGKTVYAKFYKGVYCYECAEERGLCNLQMYDENGKSIPSKKRRQASKEVQQKLLDNGTHKGWTSRKIISYPEKFWMEVLKNNNIDYSFNHVVKKSELGVENDNSNYFLDFLIDGNIDLEIDGNVNINEIDKFFVNDKTIVEALGVDQAKTIIEHRYTTKFEVLPLSADLPAGTTSDLSVDIYRLCLKANKFDKTLDYDAG